MIFSKQKARKAKSKKRFLGCFVKDEAGVTAIEFGFVAIPFFMLTLGILEVGLTLGGQYSLNYGAAVASREIRTGQAAQGGMSRSEFIGRVCDYAAMLSECPSRLMVDVRSADTFVNLEAGGAGPDPTFESGGETVPAIDPDTGGVNQAYDIGARKTPVIVTIAFEWTLVGFLGAMSPLDLGNLANGNRLMTTTEIFRNEPF